MRSLRLALSTLLVAASLAITAATPALADAPQTQTYFVCPSVSLQNDHGMWVVGQHGAYYVQVPTQGSTGSKVYLTVPVQVAGLAQIPAGWALYSSLPSYPNFAGTATLLAEGIQTWLRSPAGWNEGDMATVVANADGTYTVTDLRLGASLTLSTPIPLASAALW